MTGQTCPQPGPLQAPSSKSGQEARSELWASERAFAFERGPPMKRDMDLVRDILRQVEEKSDGAGCGDMDFPGRSEEQVYYHIMILGEAKLLEVEDRSNFEHPMVFIPIRLTWQGHEFLDAIKNDTVWSKVKEAVKEKGGNIPFAVLSTLAVKIVAAHFGLHG